MMAATDTLPSVAGIRVVHRIERPLELVPQQRPDWRKDFDSAEEPLVIHHRVGDTAPAGLEPMFEIPPWSTYYADGSGATHIRFHSVDAAEPVRLMRTVRAGREYVVEYEFAPEKPAPRRGSELAAFALALAIRGRGLMAHGSAFTLPSSVGVLCLGVSGAGKSTLAKMMLGRDGIAVLNDDRHVLSAEPHGLHVWSTPWPGSAGIAFEGDAPLGAVVLIGRAPTPTVRPVKAREALGRLLATLALPPGGGRALDQALALVTRVIEEVPVVELAYPLAPETPEWIVEQLSQVTCERARV